MEMQGGVIVATGKVEASEKIKSILIEGGYDVLGVCKSGNELIMKTIQCSPELVILSYKIPDTTVMEVYDALVGVCDFLVLTNEMEEYYTTWKNLNLNIGIAYDEAFRFYYKENIELLKEAGRVTFFSPLRDKKLPKDINFLYIGGGYPEIFKEDLSKNKELLLDIKEKLNNGLKCYAECGGLMYLTENIDGFDMVKYFSGCSYMTNSLNNFGYNTARVLKDNNMLPSNLEINAHEFHKSKVEINEETIYEIRKKDIFLKDNYWRCGYLKNNTLATYAHVHFFGNIEFIKNILK